MANFAIIDNGNIINTIVADSKEIAEQVTGKICIEFTTEPAETGGTYVNGTFIQRRPYPSWVLNSDNNWEAPVAAPEYDEENPKSYAWDESSLSWLEK